ncbi:MAG: PilZ domain-containing protein [Spirochaetaceae bacterium]|nr:PilZ domain-containing protein [Spirochaetaceae bacterium]
MPALYNRGMEQQPDFSGRKVFFLYPHSVIQEEMLDVLIMSGYEAYILRDHKKAQRLLEHFPGSIMFVNIDERMPEKEWEAYIREIQQNPKTNSSSLGILSYNTDKALMQKYLMEIAVPCGYIHLKLGMQTSTKILLDALKANEAKGRRKFIRATCEDDTTATMNYKSPDGAMYYGKLIDISSAGIATRMDKFGDFPPNSRLHEVQLKLRGTLVLTDLILMGNRKGDKNEWIFLFDPKMQTTHKLVIHRFIKQSLQRYIDALNI